MVNFKINILFRNSKFIAIGFTVNILWFICLLWNLGDYNASESAGVISKNQFKQNKIKFWYGSFLNYPARFEKEKLLQTTRYYHWVQVPNLDSRVRDKLSDALTDATLDDVEQTVIQRITELYLKPGEMYEAKGFYVLASDYFRRGFNICFYLANHYNLFSNTSFQLLFSNLRLRYAFYRNHFPIIHSEVLDSRFFSQFYSSDGIRNDVHGFVDSISVKLNNTDYYINKLFGLGLALYELKEWELARHTFYSVQKKSQSELREEALYMIGKVFSIEENFYGAQKYYLSLIDQYPYSYLADDVLLDLVLLCPRFPNNCSDKEMEIYKTKLRKDYKERDATRYLISAFHER